MTKPHYPKVIQNMANDQPHVRWIEEPKLGLAGKMYLTPIIDGLGITARHFFKVVTGEHITRQFPEERIEFDNPLIYRGVHRLNKDEQGRVKCVACFMCATACPAHCIDIVAAESPWEDREKYPAGFVIDELRCIFCGMCEEACPCDAIELTTLYDLTGASREEMIFDKEKLLTVFDATSAEEPMKTSPGGESHPGLQQKTEHRASPAKT